jgi:putative membrane protein
MKEDRYMMWHWGVGMGWWMIFGFILTVLFWAGIITLIFWLIRGVIRRGNSTYDTGSKNNALDIAKERYARGEITKEQFEKIKKDISS